MKVSLETLVDIKGGGTPSKDQPEYWGGDIPWASVKDFKSNALDKTSDYITELGVKKALSQRAFTERADAVGLAK